MRDYGDMCNYPSISQPGSVLLALYPDLDRAYLDRRIGEETFGDHGIQDLEA